MSSDEREMVTSIEMPVSQESYDKLVNFCEDFDIENMPRRSNMIFQVACYIGVHKIALDIANMTFLLGDLYLEEIESMTEGKILMVVGESPALENIAHQYINMGNEEMENCLEEPIFGFVLSNDYTGEKRLEMLESNLNEYMNGVISFDSIKARYATSDEMFDYILDGRDGD